MCSNTDKSENSVVILIIVIIMPPALVKLRRVCFNTVPLGAGQLGYAKSGLRIYIGKWTTFI